MPISLLPLVLGVVFITPILSLDNGLARTPPMGWMSWAKFRCEIDCDHHPYGCINQDLYMAMARSMVVDGYKLAGYNYIHIDDCWMEMNRSSDGKLVAHKKRFSSGVPALSNYIHNLGLKFAIYEDYGTKTCGGYPGSINHLKTDADTFAEWDVDYLKLDGCFCDVDTMSKGYPEMGGYLNKSGRPIVYSCSWPAYLVDQPGKVDYALIGNYCNLWRNFDDIELSWHSVKSIIDYYNANQDKLIKAQGPGKWNDPDMIIVGNTELTVDQARAQMTIWSIWSAPLIMSNDLRTITREYKEILLNSRVIAVDQDPMGIMGRMVFKDSSSYVYVKPVTPADTAHKQHSYAIAVLNHSNNTIHFETDLSSIGLTNQGGYNVQDLWSGQRLGHFNLSTVYKASLPPTSVVMLKATLPKMAKKSKQVVE